jgi:hypothetical protein
MFSEKMLIIISGSQFLLNVEHILFNRMFSKLFVSILCMCMVSLPRNVLIKKSCIRRMKSKFTFFKYVFSAYEHVIYALFSVDAYENVDSCSFSLIAYELVFLFFKSIC